MNIPSTIHIPTSPGIVISFFFFGLAMVFAMKAVSVSYAESRQYLLHMVPDQLRRRLFCGDLEMGQCLSIIIDHWSLDQKIGNLEDPTYIYILYITIFYVLWWYLRDYISILQYHPPATNRYIISDYVRRISLFYFWGFARISCKKSNVYIYM